MLAEANQIVVEATYQPEHNTVAIVTCDGPAYLSPRQFEDLFTVIPDDDQVPTGQDTET